MTLHHLHLLLLHFPIAGVFAGLVVLALGIVLRQQATTRLGLVGVLVTALAAWLTLLTGEGAEDAVEGVRGIVESAIETHEAAAERAVIALAVAAAAAAAALAASVAGAERWCRRIASATCLLLVVAAVAVVDTGRSGGAIRHPEIVGGGALAADPGRHDDD